MTKIVSIEEEALKKGLLNAYLSGYLHGAEKRLPGAVEKERERDLGHILKSTNFVEI